MDIGLFEDFAELAREMNFSRAAEKRNTTQPAFSRRIRQLERIIGTPLVLRTTRRVSLTPAGEVLSSRVGQILRLVADAKTEALDAAGAGQRTLNVAATHALSFTFVPSWIMRMAGPGALGRLNMVSDTMRQCLMHLQSGQVSFLISHGGPSGLGNLPERQFRSHVIGRDTLVALCAPDTDGSPLWSICDDTPVPHLAYGEASGLYAILDDHWTRHRRPALRETMTSVLAATNLEMAKKGQGVAFLPQSLAARDMDEGRLVRAADATWDVPVDIVICRPRSRMTDHCEAFWRLTTESSPPY